MKTILVIYTDTAIKSKKDIARCKKYSFNTESNLEVGDLLDSPDYSTRMQVVMVLNKKFKYYNSQTGKMSNTFDSTSQWEIRPLIIREDTEEAVYASIVRK